MRNYQPLCTAVADNLSHYQPLSTAVAGALATAVGSAATEYVPKLHDPALDPPTAAPGPLASEAGGVVYEEWRHARLVLLPKRAIFRFAKIGVVFVFLTFVRSCCRLYLCVGCK